MQTIEQDGKTYVLKSDMESAISTRLQKMSARAAEAEAQATGLQEQIDTMQGRLSTIDTLQQQIEQYKTDVETANGRFSRYQAVSKYGLTDPEQLELVEWQYNRSMEKLPKKDRTDLGEWLNNLVADPTKAPIALRPHLQALQPVEAAAEQTPGMQTITPEPALQPPRMNTGAVTNAPAPTSDNLIERGLRDLDFYREHRDQIRQAINKRGY